jgi:hypothetical protein
MFQACEVKMAKIAAHSTPIRLPGKRAMNPVTVIDRKPRMGIASSIGTSTRSAARYFAASTANTQLKTSDAASAMNMRSVVRSR